VTPAQALLLRVTSAQWLKMDDDARRVVFDALHEVVPARFLLATIVGHAPRPLPFYIDQQTLLGFYLVFGQSLVMGATDAEIATARLELERRSAEEFYEGPRRIDGHLVSPAHVVDVAPFLACESGLGHSAWARIGVTLAPGGPPQANALDAVRAQGWRLPSEAELELVRLLCTHAELGRFDDGLCADDWHEDYRGAPTRGTPWGQSAGLMRLVDDHDGLRTIRRERAKGRLYVRPFISLFPDSMGYSVEAIAARAAEPPMRAAERSTT